MSLSRVDAAAHRTVIASIGAALFILSLGALDAVSRGFVDLPTLLPPFGASTVIVFFAPDSPASRAWAVTAGHLGSALVACAVLLALPSLPVAQQAALAVAGAGVWMAVSRSIHPPGGATALLATLGGQRGAALLLPLALGCLSLLSIRYVLDQTLALSRRVRQTAVTATDPTISSSSR